jgi:hypothetical protein
MFFIRRTLLMFLISLVALGCMQPTNRANIAFVPEPGDLLFQDLDCGPLCDAIEKVTTGFQGANFSHVGIAAVDDDGSIVVIEAVSSGVKVTPLRTFLGRSVDTKGSPKVVVGRLRRTYRHLIAPAIEEAFSLEGKPYDKVFTIDNGAFYCSELIYEIFRRVNDDTPVFTLQPMTFRESGAEQTQQVWQDYFSALGAAVPEGQPGINPGSISRSATLTIIHTYGSPSRSLQSKSLKASKPNMAS